MSQHYSSSVWQPDRYVNRSLSVLTAGTFEFTTPGDWSTIKPSTVAGWGAILGSRCFEPSNTVWSIAGMHSKPQLSFADRQVDAACGSRQQFKPTTDPASVEALIDSY